ncbi:HD domain-containing phosphohydrolase [Sideroxydans sp. CL21]|uniref:HD domain-containing phosphohydrolase n=1 Tax=Sideroxydans sp. CL21 TaxID=2600596 RepID=UPI0024BCE802|nr:HD domain-containing phosphohydrolase [Sideroxydans sp. CL21]
MSDAVTQLRSELAAAQHAIAELSELIASRSGGLHIGESGPDGLESMRKQIAQAHHEWIAALDAVDDPIFLHDREFRILRANRAYQRHAGLPFGEFIGRPYYEIFPRMDGPLPGCQHVLEEEIDKDNEDEIAVDGTFYRSRAFPVHNEQGEYLFSVHSLEDTTERKEHELAMQRANRALRTISAGNQALIHATEEGQLLQDMCDVAVQVGGYRMAWIGYARDDADKTIEQMAQAGFVEGGLNLLPLTWSREGRQFYPAGDAITSGEPKVVQDILSEPETNLWHENARRNGYASCIALPLMDGKRAFGALVLFDRKVNVFDADEVGVLEEMSGDLAFGILTLRVKLAHREHAQRLQDNMLQTVEAIASIVEMRDPYTSGHQARVAELAKEIAGRMGLPEDQVQAIHLAGLVHDLGKIRIPAEILSKPGRLDEIEYSLIKMHPQAGYDILKGIDFSWPIAQMVLQHHERMDGSGYPQGLKGDEILPGARILIVADVVEAMSSHRPYRPGLGVQAALEEITKSRGVRYDPQVVDACVALFRERGHVFRN